MDLVETSLSGRWKFTLELVENAETIAQWRAELTEGQR